MISADKPWHLWLAAVSAWGLTAALTPVIRRLAIRWGCVDWPSDDRWGRRVVARLGGAAIFLGSIGATLAWAKIDRLTWGLFGGCLAIFAVGAVDDVRRLPPYIKLIWQLAVGAWLVVWGIRIELIDWLWLTIPLSIAWTVLVINAFNLLDNMDGLAAGVGAIAAAFCAFHAMLGQEWVVATMAAAVSGACLGFLHYNFPPAKIYMGDSGSYFLGLSLSALALLGTWGRSTQLLSIVAVPVLVLAVPIFDTCFVAIQRLVNGLHPFQGGTDHVSHRLATLGLGPRRTVVSLYVVSIALGLLSLLSLQIKPLSAMAIWLLILVGIVLAATYLAKVPVYVEKQPSAAAQAVPATKLAGFVNTVFLYKRGLLEVSVDFALICSAYVTAHVLRFESGLDLHVQRLIVQSLPFILVIKLVCFAGFGLYGRMPRYVGLADLLTILKSVTLGSICSAVALVYLWRFEGYSRAVVVIDWVLLLLAVSGSRLAERLLNEWIVSSAEGSVPVLIIGAGDTGELVIRQLKQNRQRKRRVVGFLDDDPRKQGNRIHGRAVLGTREALASALQVYQIREVFIAMKTPPSELVRQVQAACEPQGIRWRLVNVAMPEG